MREKEAKMAATIRDAVEVVDGMKKTQEGDKNIII